MLTSLGVAGVLCFDTQQLQDQLQDLVNRMANLELQMQELLRVSNEIRDIVAELC